MALLAQHSISVVFPAYNEKENIAKAVAQAVDCLDDLFEDWEIIIVDDGSRDGTGAIIDGLAAQDPRLVAVHHPRNEGYGAALRSGIQRARRDLIFFADSDLQFHLAELLLLLTWIEQYDVVIGYRVKRSDPLYRRINALGWKVLVRLVLGLKVKDIDCAFKMFRSHAFQLIQIDAVGAMVNTEILVQAKRMGFKIREVPVTHFPRLNGKQTGANLRVIFKAFRELIRLYVKLRSVELALSAYDRRMQQSARSISDRRVGERRKVMLPINFRDRRQVAFCRNGFGDRTGAPKRAPRLGSQPDDRPLNIAMVVASPFPANHGTPGSIREMCEAVAAKGHFVHVVTYHFGEETSIEGVRIHRIPDLGFRRRVVVGPTYEKPLLDFLLVLTLIRLIVRERIDLIHAHNYEGALAGFLARVVTRRPLVYNAINTMVDELPTYDFIKPKVLAVGLARLLDYSVPRMADQIIAISDDLSSWLSKGGIRSERIHTIPLGVETSYFDGHSRFPVRERYNLGYGPLVVYTGTLDHFQRLDYLFKAMQIVAEKVKDVRLLIVANIAGERDLFSYRRLARNLGLQDRVTFVTGRSFDDIPAVLASADVAVLPRPSLPGVPVKLLNYMAAAKPIVVFEGSAKGLSHLNTAFVVANHDWQGLGQGIVTLLQDPVLAERLGRNARAWVNQHLGWSDLARRIEAVYHASLGDAACAG